MRILRLRATGRIYSSNVYLITGDWKGLSDPNTLVDVGADPAVLDHLEELDTGLGKPKVERVVLTLRRFRMPSSRCSRTCSFSR